MDNDLIEALKKNQSEFGLNLSEEALSRLSAYYDLIQKHNALLHLVGPSSVEDFAVRHILESLALLEYLPENSKFADVGTGGFAGNSLPAGARRPARLFDRIETEKSPVLKRGPREAGPKRPYDDHQPPVRRDPQTRRPHGHLPRAR